MPEQNTEEKEMTVEEMKQKMAQALEAKKAAFNEAYAKLCKEYKMEIVAEMVLRAGHSPVLMLFPEEIK